MAKYLTEFDTYAEYSGATLSLPNVSLIKSTGEVYYKNIFAGDTLGDVLMYDIANDKLVSSFGGIWDSTTYPIASYTPIAVNVYPGSQTPDGKNRYLSVNYATRNSQTGSTVYDRCVYGPDNFSPSTDKKAFNGRANQDAAEALMPGTSGNTQAEYAAFYACSIFAAPGTNVGDWYLPSLKEMSLYKDNFLQIKSLINTIMSARSVTGYTFDSLITSTSVDDLKAYVILTDGGIGSRFGKGTSTGSVRAMISL